MENAIATLDGLVMTAPVTSQPLALVRGLLLFCALDCLAVLMFRYCARYLRELWRVQLWPRIHGRPLPMPHGMPLQVGSICPPDLVAAEKLKVTAPVWLTLKVLSNVVRLQLSHAPGTCECFGDWSGEQCQCNATAVCPTNCLDPHGECQCDGTCSCNPGYDHPATGDQDCSCSQLSCIGGCNEVGRSHANAVGLWRELCLWLVRVSDWTGRWQLWMWCVSSMPQRQVGSNMRCQRSKSERRFGHTSRNVNVENARVPLDGPARLAIVQLLPVRLTVQDRVSRLSSSRTRNLCVWIVPMWPWLCRQWLFLSWLCWMPFCRRPALCWTWKLWMWGMSFLPRWPPDLCLRL